jgi:acid phosphatase (class A)
MRRAITQASFVGVLCLALYAPTLEARECQGQSDVPIVNLLPAPPCETCPEAKVEMDELAGLERERTREQEDRVAADVKRSVDRFLDGAGIAFEPGKLRSCEKFFTKLRQEEKAAVEAAKDTFCRTRPFKTPGNPLHPVDAARRDDSFSYPSGHAAYGAAIGFLLVEMLPEKRAELYRRINDYARARMIAGAHFRSDVEAGKLIGAAVVASLFAEADFRPAFDEAKTCVRKAVGLE